MILGILKLLVFIVLALVVISAIIRMVKPLLKREFWKEFLGTGAKCLLAYIGVHACGIGAAILLSIFIK